MRKEAERIRSQELASRRKIVGGLQSVNGIVANLVEEQKHAPFRQICFTSTSQSYLMSPKQSPKFTQGSEEQPIGTGSSSIAQPPATI